MHTLSFPAADRYGEPLEPGSYVAIFEADEGSIRLAPPLEVTG